jgi:YggT family protein
VNPLGTLFISLGRLVEYVLWIYVLIIVGRCVVSWVSASPWNPLVQFLYNATEPVLRPMRRAVPFLQMGIDLTPWALILLIQFVVSPVARDLLFYAAGLFR